ncbi:LacI family DNA-binding transcriptional regulator [Nocardioides sp.]|uniref:LacI family DNA-binding transcriptional regulator n=1 Tax=Nocardioides sp. TaxID=35761 RepID=UPI00261A8079|nr:LacI family DNA-binding transcriptional regulator [Nocardioides sp.]
MTSSRITIKDVARAAGVSVTTVSHALNGKGDASVTTAERVRAIATELGYRPSSTARALQRGGLGSIALVIPRDESHEISREILALDYYMAVASSAAAAAFAAERPLVLPPLLRTADDWRLINADGVILVDPEAQDPTIDLLAELNTPVVTIERDEARPDWVHYVAGDNATNTTMVLDHLLAQGATRIALLSTDWARAWSTEIDTAYADWCTSHGLPNLRTPVPAELAHRDAALVTGQLLDSATPPDAIYAPAEGYAGGVLRACRDRGLRVPEDLLLVSGNDGRATRESNPPVTAIDLDPIRQTEAAVAMLVDLIDGRHPEVPVRLSSRLLVRESSTRQQ